jgi:putative acetyltransferase
MIKVRKETGKDFAAIGQVNTAAFGRANEAGLIEKLREHDLLTISLVAIEDNAVVGHISFCPMTVKGDGFSFTIISLGTMAVLPAYQKKGIGSRLVKTGLKDCHRIGEDVVVVVGHPTYYPRFGFVPARAKGIDCEFAEAPDDAWMILELKAGALAGRRGTVFFPHEFREAM